MTDCSTNFAMSSSNSLSVSLCASTTPKSGRPRSVSGVGRLIHIGLERRRSGDPSPTTSRLLHARHQKLGQLSGICRTVQRLRETDRRTAKLEFRNRQREDRHIQEIFRTLISGIVSAMFTRVNLKFRHHRGAGVEFRSLDMPLTTGTRLGNTKSSGRSAPAAWVRCTARAIRSSIATSRSRCFLRRSPRPERHGVVIENWLAKVKAEK
jgi:hypothetical protein